MDKTGIKLKKLIAKLVKMTSNGHIKGQVILTQAEYDALPATKETDGVIYLIRG